MRQVPRILFVLALIGCLIGSAWKPGLDHFFLVFLVGAIVF